MKEVKKLLEKKVLLQNDILCRYGKCIMELVDRAVAGEMPLLDIVSDVGASSLELFREYQGVCDKLREYVGAGEMVHLIVFSGRCQGCEKNVTLDATKHDSEPVEGGIQLFRRCPYCNERMEDDILCAAV